MNGTALEGIVVTELGTRVGVGVCGSLLSQLGATVVVVERPGAGKSRDDEGLHRKQLSAGKLSFAPRPGSLADLHMLQHLVEGSDVTLTSSDVDPSFPLPDLRLGEEACNVLCDITAFGSTGPLAKCAYSDLQVQALSGIVDTTGMPDGPPVPIGVPIVEFMTGTYAAAATLAALRVKRLSGVGQAIDMALYDCAFASLSTFLNTALTGQGPTKSRVGNRHPKVVPWNLYRALDGWVLICAGNQSQWQRLCGLIGRPDLDVASTATQEGRMARIAEIDAAIQSWTDQLNASECIQRLADAVIPSGPIVRIEGFPHEANLDHRRMIRRLSDPVSQRDIFVPGSPLLHMSASPGRLPERLPKMDADRGEVERIAESRRGQPASGAPTPSVCAPARPLVGLRVIEIGQYTTAPLCARQLAHLGAEVIKIEPPGGADGRTWAPVQQGQSIGFRAHNADKRSLVLDLQSETGRAVLTRLIQTSDVLLENLKPGSLAKLGFSSEQIARLNSRLIYCAITGFGADSLYASRPALDMVIQAMSGFMDAVAPGEIPLKSGISTADLMGGEMGIVALLAALEYRDRTGCGQYIDLSMQDITAWVAQTAWNRAAGTIDRTSSVLSCTDGYVVAEAAETEIGQVLRTSGACSPDDLANMTRETACSTLAQAGIAAAPVLTVREALSLRQTEERKLWFSVNEDGETWPLFASPLRLLRTPPVVSRPGPGLNRDGHAILDELGVRQTEAASRVAV